MKFYIRNYKKLLRDFKKYNYKAFRSAKTAVKVALYKLRKELQNAIRTDQFHFSPLTELGKRSRKSGKKKPPLYKLASLVRYQTSTSKDKMIVEFGFVGRKLNESWRKIIKSQEEGFSIRLTDELRKKLVVLGSKRGLKVIPRKSTLTLHVPSRDIIDPFWKMHRIALEHQIQKGFEAIMKGERI